MSKAQLYVVEPRHVDGSLNAKHYNPNEPRGFITGIDYNGIAAWYFRHNPGEESATHNAIASWYARQGLFYRAKYW